MAVKIRLARFGRKNLAFYRVMAADARCPRDGRHLEVLGYYNPLPGKDGQKRMGLNFERVKYWISVGAQPTEPMQRILYRAGLLPPPPMLAMTRKSGNRPPRRIHPMLGHNMKREDPSDSSQPEGDIVEPDEIVDTPSTS